MRPDDLRHLREVRHIEQQRHPIGAVLVDPAAVQGGKLLEGESHEDAAHRELREELGVAVVSVGIVCFSKADPGSEFVIDFVEVEIDGEPEALEHQALQWALPNQIGHFPMPPSDRAFANVFFADRTGESHGKA